jgi:hypothetical protein
MLPAKLQRSWINLNLIFVSLAVACSPQVSPGSSPTSIPEVEISFRTIAPEGTPPDAEISLVVLDEITGLSFNQSDFPMNRIDGRMWQAAIRLPLGSVGYYRYRLHSAESAEEFDAHGAPIQFRLVLADGAYQKRDVITAWSTDGSSASNGQVAGHLFDIESGEPVHEAIISLGGKVVFTDSQGWFRVQDMPPGEHTLTALAHDGSFLGKHQGVVIAANSETLVELRVRSAEKVSVTFELEAPPATFPGVPIRIAANLSQFGHLFGSLADGSLSEAALMPEMTPVEGSRYRYSTELFSGSQLRYRYTLGDGLWNAERDLQGAQVLRQIVIPENDVVIRDQIDTWEAGEGGATFLVNVPADTPPNDRINLQYRYFVWHNPIPMWRLANDDWFYVLYSPLSALSYRYCRNQQCGVADDIDTAGDSEGKVLPPAGELMEISDQVQGWRWLEPLTAPTIIAPELEAGGFEVGVEYLPGLQSNWWPAVGSSIAELASTGSNAITFTPTWIADLEGPQPSLRFDPIYFPFSGQLAEASEFAQSLGMQVNLRPTLVVPRVGDDFDWPDQALSQAWWASWFEHYRSFLLTYASLPGVTKLIISASQIEPSLPSDQANAPVNAEFRWREMLSEVKQVFEGTLAIELELGEALQTIPPILDEFDEVHIYWHPSLAETNQLDTSLMQLNASRWIDEVLLAQPELQNMRIILSVEYLSVDGGATACSPAPDQNCRRASEFDNGSVVDPELPVDLEEQVAAINASLLEAYGHAEIVGFYVRRYNPAVSLQDKSASVNGKPAFELLKYWYPRLVGTP